jgi:hypothetical protein
MGVQFAGRERSKKQWEELVGRVGLKTAEVKTYNPTGCNSVIVLEKV